MLFINDIAIPVITRDNPICRLVDLRHSIAITLYPAPGLYRGKLAGIGCGVMRMPFATVLMLLVLGNPALLPVSVLAAITSYLTATILDAGSARKAMRQSVAQRRKTYSDA